MPYEHKNAATYGVSQRPLPMDIAQRGICTIILMFVINSKAIGIGQLFSTTYAFMEYLINITSSP